MANRYWVGGTANWDGTAGTKWATTSGGTGGASVPAANFDDVFFTNLSTGTCTISNGNGGAKSINCTGFTGTIAGTSPITVTGSITLDAGMTYTHSGTVTITTSPCTLTTAGKTFSGLSCFSGSVTLGDALNMSVRSLTVTVADFNTANYNVTAGSFSSTTAGSRTLTLGSSTITLLNSAGLNLTNTSGLTINSGTSQINLSNANANFIGASFTFYNVSFTSASSGTRTLSGANTFNNLSLTASAIGLSQLVLLANQTVNGTLTCSGTSATSRGFVTSDVKGTNRTITANAVLADDCDFRDITIAGAASPISPIRAGDCDGNSGITFPAAKTVYWNLGLTRTWDSTAWATTATGTPAINNFPLAQDTATFTDSGAAGTISNATAFNVGTLDASGRTSAMTLNLNGTPNYYGNFILGSGVTISSSGNQTFAGRSTQIFTSAGVTITFPIIVDKPAGAFELGDATTTTNTISLVRGTFDAKNYNLTCTIFNSNFSITRTITMGSGLWTLSGIGTVWTTATTTNLTLNKDTANILLSNNTTSARTFFGGGLSYNKLTIGGTTSTSITTIGNGNTFTELASTKTVAHTIRFSTAVGGYFDTWSVTGTVGNVVTVDSSVAGTRRTIYLTNVTSGIDYLSVKDIGITDVDKFYVGVNSIDGGNNSNVYFTASPSSGDLIYESITLTELITALLTSVNDVSETTTLSEAQSATYVFVGDIIENQTLTDTQSALANYLSVISELQVLTDMQNGLMIYPSDISETATLTDTQTGDRTMYFDATESMTLSDDQSALYVFTGTVIELLPVTDVVSSLAIYNSNVSEQVYLIDFQINRGWYVIDTAQAENWNPVNNAQTSGWTQVNNSQPSNWTLVDDKQ